MSSGMDALQHHNNGNDGNRMMTCPLYGCKRVYKDVAALNVHISDHQIPTQSLPGKVFQCSSAGCGGSFPNMQKLMEHMRHHHKPNIFFSCENCRAKLRSYRGLLTHLHTCSKVPRGRMKSAEPMDTQSAAEAGPSTSPTAMEPSSGVGTDAPMHDPASASTPLSPHIPNKESSSLPQPASAGVPVSRPPSLLNQMLSHQQQPSAETSLPHQQPGAETSLPQTQPETLYAPAQLSLDAQAAASHSQAVHNPHIQSQGTPQMRTTQPVSAAPLSSPQSPPGSTAVWRKNQGVSSNRRILWEHTRGQYRCVQCGHSGANRREITAHINTQHRNPAANKPAAETGGPVPDA